LFAVVAPACPSLSGSIAAYLATEPKFEAVQKSLAEPFADKRKPESRHKNIKLMRSTKGLLGLCTRKIGEKIETSSNLRPLLLPKFCAKPSQPVSITLEQMEKLKKGRVDFLRGFGAYRFLSISTITTVATMITMRMTIDIGRKYMSASDAGGGVGGAVGVGSSNTLNAVSACEGQ
jgi:hypothetical protein